MVPQDGRGPGALGRRSNPGWQSGSRTWCCRGCGVGHKCFSDLIPGQETVYVMWDGQKEGGKKKDLITGAAYIPSPGRCFAATLGIWIGPSLGLGSSPERSLFPAVRLLFCFVFFF